jgi:hypothetical protein
MAMEDSVSQILQIAFTILIIAMLGAKGVQAESIQMKAPFAFLIDATTGTVL